MDPADKPLFQILLAEDNPADVMLVRIALRNAGLTCALTVVDDGEKAISLIKQWDEDSNAPAIDLLLLDLHLPKREGGDILNCLRSTERNAQSPVIVMTASDAPEDHETAQKYAAIHYFRKPNSLDEFMHLGVIARGVLAQRKSSEKEISEPWSRGGAA